MDQPINPDLAQGAVPEEFTPEQVAAAQASPQISPELQQYLTPGQQALGAAEQAVGALTFGAGVPAIERGLTALGVPGLTPEAQVGREQALEAQYGVGAYLPQAAGLVASQLTGVGEAALASRAGELAGGIFGGSEALAARMASGVARAATEFGTIAAQEHAGRLINSEATGETVGSAISGTLLSAALGGVLGAGAGAAGYAGSKLLEKGFLRDLRASIGSKFAGFNEQEAFADSLAQSFEKIRNMGTEIGGTDGIKSTVLARLMPEEVSPEMSKQVYDLFSKSADAIDKIDNPQYQKDLQRTLDRFIERLTPAEEQGPLGPKQLFDAVQDYKREIQDIAKPGYNRPSYLGPMDKFSQQEYNAASKIAYEARQALEDTNIWGEAGQLQKDFNSTLSPLIAYNKQMGNKFFSLIGDKFEPSEEKIARYFKAADKATTPIDRQKIVGGWVDAAEKHFDQADKLFEKYGIENPHELPSLDAVKSTYADKSLGTRLGDLLVSKLSAQSVGNLAGMAVGAKLLPGISGVYAGRWVLGPVFGAILPTLMDKGILAGRGSWRCHCRQLDWQNG
jgi:hypothetical protein